MYISDWSSDGCSSDLLPGLADGSGDIKAGEDGGVAMGLTRLLQRLAPSLVGEIVGFARVHGGGAIRRQLGDDEIRARRRKETLLLQRRVTVTGSGLPGEGQSGVWGKRV